MKEFVEGKRLVNQFNKYVEYRRTVEKSSGGFDEQLAGRIGRKGSRSNQSSLMPDFDDLPKFKGLKKRDDTAPRKLARNRPMLGRPKRIHSVHANRLAKYAPLIERAAVRYGVPVELICGVILQESGCKAKARSHAGACGLMQLMPQTARRFGVRDAFDPAQNIDGGTKYLGWLLERFNGNVELALAGYNAGEHNVEKYGNRIPPFKETQEYVPNVLGYTQTMVDIFLAQAEPIDISPMQFFKKV